VLPNKFFAAFVMTYQRANILPETLKSILNQTFPPEFILIVDNSDDNTTEQLVLCMNLPNIGYHRVGYNSGPAGASHIGLKILAEQGYKWIYWGDDDDPPRSPDMFEKLLKHTNVSENVGQIGFVGHKFSFKNAKISKIRSEYLTGKGALEVDTIAGGMCKIVKGEVVLKGILPDKSLFFGFEDLDFDLKLKKAGYVSLIDQPLLLRERAKVGKLASTELKSKTQLAASWREYYSIRSLLFILSYHKQPKAILLVLLRKISKIPLSYRYGLKNGNRTAKIVTTAIADWIRNKRVIRKF